MQRIPAPIPSQLEQTFFAKYKEFFDHAEEKRRWNLQSDIPWAEIRGKGSIGEDLVSIIESFWAVEMYIPDYAAKLTRMFRRNRGFAWFELNWGYEESKHSRAIEEWLIRSGHRTEKDVAEYADRLLQNEWNVPFDTPRRMFQYTMIQELATQVNYLGVTKLCKDVKDPALDKALLLIAGDEGNHHRFFADMVKVFLDDDREGTLQDLAYVLSKFEMPAHYAIPNWERYGKLIESSGIYNGRVFVRRVLFPILERLGITRDELKSANDAIAA